MGEVPLYPRLGQVPGMHRCGPKVGYRGTWVIRNSAPLGPDSRNMPRALWSDLCVFATQVLSVRDNWKRTGVPRP